MVANIENSISTKDLLQEYTWFHTTFADVIQEAFDTFFDKNFTVKFFGLSKNINCLLGKEKCFVTKVQIDREYEAFFRLTDKVIEIILDKVLGKSKISYNINKITAIEAKIITSFNRDMFEKIKPLLSPPNPKEIKRTNFNMINLTFILKDSAPDAAEAGRVIITLPEALLEPQRVELAKDIVSETDFPESKTPADIIVGTTRFTMYEVKHLEKGDVVVFENSSIDKLKMMVQGEELEVNINPNMSILIPEYDNEGEEEMSGTHNIWDSIEVDMKAEFDAIKISLGDLKSIEQGLVVDLASLYDNNVTLKVEGKEIASGSLVIVNDRYGVKVNEVIAKKDKLVSAVSSPGSEEDDEENSEYSEEDEENEEYSEEGDENEEEEYSEEEEQEGSEEDEEFDYSDFELEDENI
ncbi:FliM/FliN family flagellar motor switch protein [bacterium]|nr:FliM/FliN family flagellar motor switch protein [bacterium]